MTQAPYIVLPATLESLPQAQAFLDGALPEGYQSQRGPLRLVAEELLVNIFNYAYEGSTAKKVVKISLGVAKLKGEDKLLLSLEHQGSYFDPFKKVPQPNLTLSLESRVVGGLGVFFVKEFSDAQFCLYDGTTTCLQTYFGKTAKQ